jgi:hypothetical protein
MELAGVPREVAEEALAKHKEVWLAVDSLIVRPTVSGDKHVPVKRKLEVEIDPEQDARCKKGRWLQDQVNAVFSVAHSKIRTQPDLQAGEDAAPPVESPPAELPMTAELSQQQGSHEKRSQPSPQSASPP